MIAAHDIRHAMRMAVRWTCAAVLILGLMAAVLLLLAGIGGAP